MVKATDSNLCDLCQFTFGMHAPRDSPDMTLEFFSKRGRGQGHVTPNFFGFWALNANSFKMVKATDSNLCQFQ